MVGKDLTKGTLRAHAILEAIQELQKGDRVVVTWHDACRVTNDPDVRPEYYSTPKETQGTVHDCVPDPDYPDVFYLILTGETTAGRPDYYDAIPVAWISRVDRLELPNKYAKKAVKVAPGIIAVDRYQVFKGGVLVSDSGGVDKLTKKWAHSADGVKKIIEELTKVVA